MTRAATHGIALALVLVLAPVATAAPPPLRASVAIAPALVAFGDVVEARLVVDLAAGHVDPGSLRVAAVFAPYQASGQPAVIPGRSVVTYRYALSCLTEACLPRRDGFAFHAIVTALVDGSRRTVHVDWPRLFVAALVSDQTAAGPPPRLRANTSLPPVTASASGSRLIALLVAGAVVLGIGAAALLLVAIRRPKPARPALPPLERAIALVRETARQGDERRRRRALESLAGTLQDHGAEALGNETRTLAWSSVPPAPEPMDDLAERVSREVAAP
ncbi:MAG: hypothetical protein QOF43_1173 [Gaiellaceae bacterium]|nr:hypothetical protein [Gaiellaceae bacterium]